MSFRFQVSCWHVSLQSRRERWWSKMRKICRKSLMIGVIKRGNILGLLILLAGHVFSQRYDNTWMFGFSDALPFRTTSMNFSGGAPDTSSHMETLSMYITNASISDSAGNLLFYTNGVRIYKRNHNSLPGSNGFNPGWATIAYSSGLPEPQGILILPKPGFHNVYGIFHESADTLYRGGVFDVNPRNLRYTEVQVNQSGNGTVSAGSLNVLVLTDTLALGRLTACRHANGRDWWIIAHKYWSNCWYKFLYSPAGISLVDSQCIGRISRNNDVFGNQNSLLTEANTQQQAQTNIWNYLILTDAQAN